MGGQAVRGGHAAEGGFIPSVSWQEEREKRRLEQLERKKELQRLLEEEDSKLKGKAPKQAAPAKVTRAQIEETLRKDQQQEDGDAGAGLPWRALPGRSGWPQMSPTSGTALGVGSGARSRVPRVLEAGHRVPTKAPALSASPTRLQAGKVGYP